MLIYYSVVCIGELYTCVQSVNQSTFGKCCISSTVLSVKQVREELEYMIPIAYSKFRLKLKKVGKTTRPFRYDLKQISYDYTVEVRNRFKGLDMIDRVSDELWNEVHDIVQQTGNKIIAMEKKCKKAKWLSGEALQIAVKRREAKSKGEKERYKHLNAEFQKIEEEIRKPSSAINAKK